jgi:UDP-2,3-diacylglucosamine hydrolase
MPGSRLVIVSDAHLGAAPADTEEALEAFLEAVPRLGDALLVNGDLFDFWFAYRHVIPRRGARVLSLLGALARKLPIVMTGGNHDRWGDSFWESDLGIRFSGGELRFEVGALLFRGEAVKKRIAVLSGGERASRTQQRIRTSSSYRAGRR